MLRSFLLLALFFFIPQPAQATDTRCPQALLSKVRAKLSVATSFEIAPVEDAPPEELYHPLTGEKLFEIGNHSRIQLVRIELPAGISANPDGVFFLHPTFPDRLAWIQSHGGSVIIDPSLKNGAFFDPEKKLHALSSAAPILVLEHEVAHLAFMLLETAPEGADPILDSEFRPILRQMELAGMTAKFSRSTREELFANIHEHRMLAKYGYPAEPNHDDYFYSYLRPELSRLEKDKKSPGRLIMKALAFGLASTFVLLPAMKIAGEQHLWFGLPELVGQKDPNQFEGSWPRVLPSLINKILCDNGRGDLHVTTGTAPVKLGAGFEGYVFNFGVANSEGEEGTGWIHYDTTEAPIAHRFITLYDDGVTLRTQIGPDDFLIDSGIAMHIGLFVPKPRKISSFVVRDSAH